MYLLFIEKGTKSLSKKGHLCYINPIRFFNSDYGFGCRKYLINNASIISVLDISQLSVFQNAMTYPCVLLIGKERTNNNNILYRRLDKLSELQIINRIKPIITPSNEIAIDPEYRFILYVSSALRQVVKKIDLNKKTIVSSEFYIARGLANAKVKLHGSAYKALKSTNVRKYYIEGDLKDVDSAFGDTFKDEMIILPRTVEFLQAMIKGKDIVCLDRIYYLSPKNKVDLKYVLGIINSLITNLWFEYYYKTTKVAGNYFDLNGNQIGSIPIPSAKPSQQKEIISLVDTILSKKKANPQTDTSAEEKKIDKLVYELYGLEPEEIRILEEQ